MITKVKDIKERNSAIVQAYKDGYSQQMITPKQTFGSAGGLPQFDNSGSQCDILSLNRSKFKEKGIST